MKTRLEELNERLFEAEAGRNKENQDALREQIKEELKKEKSLEHKARMMTTCPVCGAGKSSGEHSQVVCWGECWRGKDGLKYTELTTEEWLKQNWGKKINE